MKNRLEGSSIIEVVVASVLFLIMFVIAMETLTRSTGLPDAGSLLQAEADLAACIKAFETEAFPEGEYEKKYAWGTIKILVSTYKDIPDINEILFMMNISQGKHTVMHRILKVAAP